MWLNEKQCACANGFSAPLFFAIKRRTAKNNIYNLINLIDARLTYFQEAFRFDFIMTLQTVRHPQLQSRRISFQKVNVIKGRGLTWLEKQFNYGT